MQGTLSPEGEGGRHRGAKATLKEMLRKLILIPKEFQEDSWRRILRREFLHKQLSEVSKMFSSEHDNRISHDRNTLTWYARSKPLHGRHHVRDASSTMMLSAWLLSRRSNSSSLLINVTSPTLGCMPAQDR